MALDLRPPTPHGNAPPEPWPHARLDTEAALALAVLGCVAGIVALVGLLVVALALVVSG